MNHIIWACDLIEVDTTPYFPIIRRVSREIQAATSYRWSGSEREGGNNCLFQYTLSGCGELVFNGESYAITPGKGLLCQVKDPRATYQYPAWASEPWEFLYMIFQGEVAFRLFDGWIDRRGPVGSIDPGDPLLARLAVWEQEDQATVHSGYGLSIIEQFFRALSAGHSDHPSKGAMRARKAFELMQGELHNNRSVDWFAHKLHVSREQLSRDFTGYFSSSPFQTYRRLRIEAAARDLVKGERSISSIAERYSWATTAHFSRIFSQLTGISPSTCQKSGVVPLLDHQ